VNWKVSPNAVALEDGTGAAGGISDLGSCGGSGLPVVGGTLGGLVARKVIFGGGSGGGHKPIASPSR